MRLGAYPCKVQKGTLASQIYGRQMISERHRHRYELNNLYADELQAAGLHVSGINPQSRLAEIVEIPEHPFFIATQFHPELKSTPEHPQPIFVHFVKAALNHKSNKKS